MRRTAVGIAGAAALASLLGLAVPVAVPAHAGSGTAPATNAPARACEEEPQEGVSAKSVPLAQRMFGTTRIWPMSTGANVTVAVLDSGVDAGHPQLKASNIGSGADFMSGNGSGNGRYDCDGHGTAVISLIAAQKIENVGFQGLAYEATVLPVIVSDDHDEDKNVSHTTTADKFARAIDWAVQNDAKVINISLTMPQDHPAVKRAIGDAIAQDVVVVAAAGNGAIEADPSKGVRADAGTTPYPAAYDQVIGVGAVDETTRPLPTSQAGTYVDLVAPGDGIQVANRGAGDHTAGSGTGFATAFVSATAALVRSKWPELSAKEVARRLFATASPAAGPTGKVGHGLVDPYRALTEGLSDEQPKSILGASPQSPDAATVARAEERRQSGTTALAAGGIGVVLGAVMLATLTLLPKGSRRRWRPGRAKAFPEPTDDEGDLPPAPVKLFDRLETP